MVALAGLAATRTRPVTRAGLVDRADPAAQVAVAATPVVLAAPVDRAGQVTTLAVLAVLVVTRTTQAGLAAPADQVTTRVDRAAPADRATTQAVRADPADRATTPAVPVGLVGPANAVVPIPTLADPGMATSNVATSTGLRGVTVRRRGGLAPRRDRTGEAGRFLRPVGTGIMARSTTGATRKPPFGTPGSTHGASGSSESGSRCKEQ